MFPDFLAVLQKAVTGRSGCVLSSPTVILSCDPDCLTLHWAVVRDTAVPTLQTLLILCSTALQAYKDSLVLMQQKATEKIKHICTRNTPTGGQRQIHSPPAPLSVRTNVVFVCVGLLLHIFFYSAGPGVPVWAPKRDWLFSLHNQLVKVLISSGTG